MPDPIITFVSAFIDLNEERIKDRTPETRTQLFRQLATSGISICLYVSSTYENIGKTLENEYPNVKLMPIINLEDTETYKLIKSFNPVLPVNRCTFKDTLNYMILQNAKSEFVYNAILSNPYNTEHFAWIDFSICHVLSGGSDTNTTHPILQKLYNASISKLNLNTVLFPSCFSFEKSKYYFNILTTHIIWRFCGGFFIGDKTSLQNMYFLMLKELPNFITQNIQNTDNNTDNNNNTNNIISWEVNVWVWLEHKCNWIIDSYQADHNNSILDIPDKYISIIDNDITDDITDDTDDTEDILHDYKNMYKTTIVTFYFNIKKLNDATSLVRTQSFYMQYGRETLKLNYPMLIFCDETTYDEIKTIRDEYINDLSLTQYIIKNITDYNFYKKNIDKITKNRIANSNYKNSRNTPSYYLVTMFKIIALYIAKQKNFFNTDYYAWIDFGGSHIMKDFNQSAIKMLDNPNPKISLCYIHYRTKEEMYTLLRSIGGFCGIAATSFTLEKEYIKLFYDSIFILFYELLNNGIGHSEEQILTLFYDQHPDLCNIYYGDYYSILSNYHEPILDIHCIIHNYVKECINKGRTDLAVLCAHSLINSSNKNNINSDTHNIEYLETIIKQSNSTLNSNTTTNIDNNTNNNKSNINKYIDKVIYINLEHRKDRKQEIEQELNNYNIEYERFNAVSTPEFGIVGCTQSHLEVFKMAKSRGYKNILIFEDDFMFVVSKETLEEQIELLFNSNSTSTTSCNFDICMLSYNLIKSKQCNDYPFLKKVLEVQTTSGYIVNENMYDILIDLYSWTLHYLNTTQKHWIYALDQIWKILQPISKWYCFDTRIGKQRPSYSDLGNKWSDGEC